MMVNSGVQNRYVNRIAMGQSGLRLKLFSDPDPLRPSLPTLATSTAFILGTYRQMMMRMRLNPLTTPGRRMTMELGRILARWPSALLTGLGIMEDVTTSPTESLVEPTPRKVN